VAEHSADVKAAAMAALLAGQSVSSVARDYHIPKGTVSGWKDQAVRDATQVATPPTQKAAIGELVLGYLEANLRALRAQADCFADPEWLKQQQANELAVLHGVMTDKAVRLLEALSAGG
jgi:transposase-like protein